MVTMQTVDDFIAQKKLAVVGVSRNKQKFGNTVYRELKEKGYTVYPVNPYAEKIGDDTCYASLNDLPETVDGAVLVLKPEQTEAVVRDAKEAGITRIWMQQGAESGAAIEFCEQNGIPVISKLCILMFAEPVASFHKIHRFFKNLFGRMPAANA